MLFRTAATGNALNSESNFVKSGFCDVTKMRNAELPMTLTDKTVYSRKREMVEKCLRHLFTTSSSLHFFNKTNFEQYSLTKIQYCCCCSTFLSSCHQTALDQRLVRRLLSDDPYTFHCNNYLVL